MQFHTPGNASENPKQTITHSTLDPYGPESERRLLIEKAEPLFKCLQGCSASDCRSSAFADGNLPVNIAYYVIVLIRQYRKWSKALASQNQ
jgi:hypothetical protein